MSSTITADTNLLARLIVRDDPAQTALARLEVTRAARVIVPLPVLCELVWILRGRYRTPPADIADALEALLSVENVVADVEAAGLGLALLRTGGDFADGVIAEQGRRAGASTFVSFDRAAVKKLTDLGEAARLPLVDVDAPRPDPKPAA